MSRRPITILLLLICSICSAQSVRFMNDNLDGAIALAQSRDQPIFVDTYAPWCIPCKKMEKEFRDPNLAEYFNRTFVNIRIDMDTPLGKELHKKYDVIFLPTMMILNKDGTLRFKVDQALSAKNLLDIAQKIVEPEIYSTRPTYTSAPPPPPPTARSVETEELVKKLPQAIIDNPDLDKEEVIVHQPVTAPVEGEIIQGKDIIEGTIVEQKIIHVFDGNSDNLPPEILKQEAYLKLQLMDGSHDAAAKKYLDTQDDWSKEPNMRFIMDFVSSTESRAFQHIINNKTKYIELFGNDRVYKNISILVYDRLNRGFPRPTFQETQDLFSYLDEDNYMQYSYEHYMESLYSRKKLKEYGKTAEEYISSVHSMNDQVYFRLAMVYSEDKRPGKFIRSQYCIAKAIEINPQNYRYHETEASLYYRDNNKTAALKSAIAAKTLALKNGQGTKDIDVLINMIQEDL